MMRHRVRLLLAAALLSLCSMASAHRFHMGIVELAYNARSGSNEIVHTYMAHDMEALLMNLYQRQFDLGEPEDQAVLRKYVEERFTLKDKDGKRLPVRWVGMTVDSQSVTVYQELEKAPLDKTAAIRHSVLTDFLPDQVNTVNLNEGGKIRSLTFTLNTPEQATAKAVHQAAP